VCRLNRGGAYLDLALRGGNLAAALQGATAVGGARLPLLPLHVLQLPLRLQHLLPRAPRLPLQGRDLTAVLPVQRLGALAWGTHILLLEPHILLPRTTHPVT
jgi:hypothetical protein